MGSNAPEFDPLNATPEEQGQMFAGYMAAGERGAAIKTTASMAFEHGWRMRRNDMAGVVDDDQRALAKRVLKPKYPSSTIPIEE